MTASEIAAVHVAIARADDAWQRALAVDATPQQMRDAIAVMGLLVPILRALVDDLAIMRPVFELADRWCNRPESVLRVDREPFPNDVEIWLKLRALIADARAKVAKR